MNQALLFSLALAGPTTPLVCPFSMQIDDVWCRGYHGTPCVLDPEFCCSTFVGYAFKATCERGVGWELTPHDPMPMCGDCSDGGALAPSAVQWAPSISMHDSETENSHRQNTNREENSGDGWMNSRDRSNDLWVDGSHEEWALGGPTWLNTGDKTSTSVRTGDRDTMFNAHLTGENWSDRTAATWDNRNAENKRSTDAWGVDWRNWEQSQKGSKTNEEWGDVNFDHHGMSASSGKSSTLKNREGTDDSWGQTDLWGNQSEGSRKTRNWRDDESRSQIDVDSQGNSRQNSHSKTSSGDHESTSTSERDHHGNSSTSSSSSTSTSSGTRTSSSSRWGGRRRLPRRAADRLAQAEAVEPSLGDFVHEMLAPSA